jgi:hypothetical protein
MSSLIKLIESDDLIEFQKQDKFLEFINQDPPKSWIKEHPIAKNVDYLPIDKVELLLKRIFQEYKVEILREGQMLNSIYITVRLHYKHPISGWTYQDGTAAVPIKTKKGENASNMAAILNDAIQTGLPAAESFAIKDAADKIGNIFGGNLNRKDVLDFNGMYTQKPEVEEEIATSIEAMEQAETLDDLANIFMNLAANIKVDPRIISAKDKRKAELNGTEA